jgi:hypothetical protein
MFSDEEKLMFIEHSLESRENLRISINAAFSFNELKKRLFKKFISTLEFRLKESLGDLWVVDNGLDGPDFEKYRGFYIQKSEWDKKFKIGISSDSGKGDEMFFGVAKQNEIEISSNKIREELNSKFRNGNESLPHWCWWQRVDAPFKDFNLPESLLGMFDGQMVDYFYENILRIQSCVSSIIDELLEHK